MAMNVTKPAGKRVHVLATELNFSNGPPAQVPLAWTNNAPAGAIIMTPDADTLGCVFECADMLGCVFECADMARTTSVNFTVTATAPNGKTGSGTILFTPDPTVVSSVSLANDPAFDP